MMPRQSILQRLSLCVVVVAALMLGQRATAQTPAQLAPADTAVFVHIHKPAGWFGDLTDGPLGKKLRDKIETQNGSGDLLAALGMDTDEFMEAYFGKELVILGPGGDEDGVIFTQVSEDDRDHAITSLALKRNGAIAGNPVYTGDDGNGYIVMMKDWVAMCDANAADYLREILERNPNTPSLADSKQFKYWTTQLPADRDMTVFITDGDEQHTLGVVRQGRGLDATYLGKSPNFDEMMDMLGKTEVADFGPLPVSTISALSFNLKVGEKQKGNFAMLDAMLGGKSFVNDVMPKLDAPTLMFMGAVDGKTTKPAVKVEVPVVGLAVKMSDDSAAGDLKRIMDQVVGYANLSMMQFQAGMMPQRGEQYKGASFQVAEVGTILSKGLKWPEVAPMQIVYGQVGDYYLICTQEEFFKQCVDAAAGDGKGVRIPVEGKAHKLAVTPVMAMTARPDGFAQMIRSWVKLVEAEGLPAFMTGGVEADEEAEDADAADDAPAPAAKANPIDFETLYDIIGVMQQYSRMKLQVWKGEDGVVVGRAQLTAPQ